MCFFARVLILIFAFLVTLQASADFLFCESAFDSVCHQNRIQQTYRERRMRAILDPIRREALQATARDHLALKDSDRFTLEDLEKLKPESRRKLAMAYFLGQIHDQVLEYLESNRVPLSLNYELIRESFKRLVDSNQELEAKPKTKILTLLDQVEILTLNRKVMLNLTEDSDSFTWITKECGKDGLDDNAFADTRKGRKIVVVCPGALVASIEFAKHFSLPLELHLTPLAMTLGHETGHHFDWDVLPGAYKSFAKCLHQHYRSNFKSQLEDYLSEVTADFWGIQLLSQELAGVDFLLRERVVAGALEDLCDAHDDGVHPEGRFRIEKLAALSTPLRAALACRHTSEKDCRLSNTD